MDDDEADDAFAAGFNQELKSSETLPKTTQTDTPSQDAPTDSPQEFEDDPPGDKPPAEERPIYNGLTAKQIDELAARAAKVDELEGSLSRIEQKLSGHIGNIIRQIKEMREQGVSAQKIAVTKDSLKRLSSEYPDLAEALAEDLAEMSGGAISDDVLAQFEARATAAAEKQRADVVNQLGFREMNRAHPTWRDDIKTDDYGKYVQSLSADDQAFTRKTAYDSIEDFDKAIEIIGGFKKWREAQKKPETKPKNSGTPTRLARAMTPRSDTGGGEKDSEDEDDAFMDGYKSVRQGA